MARSSGIRRNKYFLVPLVCFYVMADRPRFFEFERFKVRIAFEGVACTQRSELNLCHANVPTFLGHVIFAAETGSPFHVGLITLLLHNWQSDLLGLVMLR